MATRIPSRKLKVDFGWLLDRVTEGLDISECQRIARAEDLPKSKISDSERVSYKSSQPFAREKKIWPIGT